MRKVRLIPSHALPERRAYRPESLEESSRQAKRMARIRFFRHECSDRWFEELLEATALSGRRLTPSRARRLIVAALREAREDR